MSVKIGGAYVELGLKLTDFEKGLANAQAGLKNFGTTFRDLGLAMTAAFTVPLAGFVKVSSDAFEKFQTSINATSSLIDNVTKQQVSALSTLAISLGKTTKFSANEAASAMKELAAAGYETKTIMAALPGVINLAAAGGINLAEATTIAVGVMGGFNMPASKMEYAASLIAKAANVSAISVSDLGFTFKYIAPIAKGVGISFEEVSASAAILGNSFIRAEQAGTSLRGIVARLVDPSRENAKAFERLGLNVFDASGKMNSLANIIGQFEKKGLQARDVIKLFGQEAGVGMVALLNKGSKALEEMTDKMKNAGNEAEIVAKARLQGFAGQMDLLRANLSTFAVESFVPLEKYAIIASKAFVSLLDGVRVLIDGFKSLPDGVQDTIVVFTALVAVVGPMITIFGQLAVSLGSTKLFTVGVQGAQAMLGAMSALGAGIVNLPATFENIGFALRNGMTGALVGTEAVILTMGQLALAAAAAYAAFKYLEDLGPVFRQMGEDAEFAASTIANGIAGALTDISMAAADSERAFAGTTSSVETMADSFVTATDVVKFFHTAWEGFLSFLASASGLKGFKDIVIGIGEIIGVIGAKAKALAYIASDVGASIENMGAIARKNKSSIESIYAINAMDMVKGRGDFIAATQALEKTLSEQGKVVIKNTMTWDEYRAALNKLAGPTKEVAKNFDYLYAKQKKHSEGVKESQKFIDEWAKNVQKQYEVISKLNDDLMTGSGMAKAVARGGQEVFKEIELINRRLKELKINPELNVIGFSADLETIKAKLIETFSSEQTKFMSNIWREAGPLMDNYISGLNKIVLKSEEAKNVLAGISESFLHLGDSYKKQLDMLDKFGIKTIKQSDDAFKSATQLKEVIDQMYAKGQISQEQYFQAQLKYLQAAKEYAIAHGQEFKHIDVEIGNVTNGIKKMGGEVKNASNVMDPLVRQLSSIVNDLGKGLTDAIISGKNLGSVFVDALSQIGKAILRFTTETMINTFIKSIKDGQNEFLALGRAFESMFDKFKNIFTRGGGVPSLPVPGGGSPIPSTPGVGTGFGFDPGLITSITGVAQAIFGGLQYLQGRRQEQDIGRVEVSSRGTLSQLISIQETLNLYLPWLINLKYLQNGISTTAPTPAGERGQGEGGYTSPNRPGQSFGGYSNIDTENPSTGNEWRTSFAADQRRQTDVYNQLHQVLGNGAGVGDFYNLDAKPSQSQTLGEQLVRNTANEMESTNKEAIAAGQKLLEAEAARRNRDSKSADSYGLGKDNEIKLKQMASNGSTLSQMFSSVDWSQVDLSKPIAGLLSKSDRAMAILNGEQYAANTNKTGKQLSLGTDGNIYDQTGLIHLDLSRGRLEVNATLKSQSEKDAYAKQLLGYIEQQGQLGKSWEEMTVDEKKHQVEVNTLSRLREDTNKAHIVQLQTLGAELGYTVDEYGKVVRYVPVIGEQFLDLKTGLVGLSTATIDFGSILGQSASEIAAYQKSIALGVYNNNWNNNGSITGGPLTATGFNGPGTTGSISGEYKSNWNNSPSITTRKIGTSGPYDPNQYNAKAATNQLQESAIKNTMSPEPLVINVYANNATDGNRVANEFIKTLHNKGIYF